jgi:hypothetical protein
MTKGISLALFSLLFGSMAMAQKEKTLAPPAPPPPPPPMVVAQPIEPPPPPPPPAKPHKHGKHSGKAPKMERMSWTREVDIVRVKTKSGAVETYDLSSEQDRKKYVDKYGKLPPPPPPPPKVKRED